MTDWITCNLPGTFGSTPIAMVELPGPRMFIGCEASEVYLWDVSGSQFQLKFAVPGTGYHMISDGSTYVYWVQWMTFVGPKTRYWIFDEFGSCWGTENCSEGSTPIPSDIHCLGIYDEHLYLSCEHSPLYPTIPGVYTLSNCVTLANYIGDPCYFLATHGSTLYGITQIGTSNLKVYHLQLNIFESHILEATGTDRIDESFKPCYAGSTIYYANESGNIRSYDIVTKQFATVWPYGKPLAICYHADGLSVLLKETPNYTFNLYRKTADGVWDVAATWQSETDSDHHVLLYSSAAGLFWLDCDNATIFQWKNSVPLKRIKRGRGITIDVDGIDVTDTIISEYSDHVYGTAVATGNFVAGLKKLDALVTLTPASRIDVWRSTVEVGDQSGGIYENLTMSGDVPSQPMDDGTLEVIFNAISLPNLFEEFEIDYDLWLPVGLSIGQGSDPISSVQFGVFWDSYYQDWWYAARVLTIAEFVTQYDKMLLSQDPIIFGKSRRLSVRWYKYYEDMEKTHSDFFIDGILEDSDFQVGSMQGDGSSVWHIWAAAGTGVNGQGSGYISDARVYTDQRSILEIGRTMWNRLTAIEVIDTALLLYWKLDETAGSTAYDSTLNELNGTVTGTPGWGMSPDGWYESDEGSDGHIFSGYVKNITKNRGKVSVDFEDKLSILQKSEAETPESTTVQGALIELILAAGLHADTDTIASVGDLDSNCILQTTFVSCQKICDAVGLHMYYDPRDDYVHANLPAAGITRRTIYRGGGLVGSPYWGEDKTQLYNKVTVMPYNQTTHTAQDDTSIATYGLKSIIIQRYDLSSSTQNVDAQTAAEAFLAVHKDPADLVDLRLSPDPIMPLWPGDRITVVDRTKTGADMTIIKYRFNYPRRFDELQVGDWIPMTADFIKNLDTRLLFVESRYG